jgi:hypothetical protein
MARKGSKRRGGGSFARVNGTGYYNRSYGSTYHTPPSYTPEAMNALQANIDKAVAEGRAMRHTSDVLYDPAMGNVQGGSVSFKPDGVNHQTYYGGGQHVSWNVNPDGSVTGLHPTDQNAPNNDPSRHNW